MNCTKCGHDEFDAHQIVRMCVVVDGKGNWLRVYGGGEAEAIYDSETPYGPFTCMSCGAVYDELPK